jgi:hypothetical protein
MKMSKTPVSLTLNKAYSDLHGYKVSPSETQPAKAGISAQNPPSSAA